MPSCCVAFGSPLALAEYEGGAILLRLHELLDGPSVQLKMGVTSALASLAEADPVSQTIGEQGSLSKLQELAQQSKHRKLQQLAHGALRVLATCQANRVELAELQVRAAKRFPPPNRGLTMVLAPRSGLNRSFQWFCRGFVTRDLWFPLLQVAPVLRQLCSNIQLPASADTARRLAGLGQEVAAMCRENASLRVAVGEMGGPTLLVSLLGHAATNVQLAAADAVRELARNAANRDRITQCEGLPALLNLLRLGHPSVKRRVQTTLDLVRGPRRPATTHHCLPHCLACSPAACERRSSPLLPRRQPPAGWSTEGGGGRAGGTWETVSTMSMKSFPMMSLLSSPIRRAISSFTWEPQCSATCRSRHLAARVPPSLVVCPPLANDSLRGPIMAGRLCKQRPRRWVVTRSHVGVLLGTPGRDRGVMRPVS